MQHASGQKKFKIQGYLQQVAILLVSLNPILSQSQISFGTPQFIGNSDDAKSIQMADLNSDGFPDAVWMSFQGTVFWSLGDGNGGFGTVHELDQPIIFVLYHFDLGDIDNDGDLDVVIIGSGTHETENNEWLDGQQIYWYPNLGSGNFYLYEFLHNEETFNGVSLEVEDMNDDGLVDIVASYGIGDNIEVYLNQSGASFGNQIVLSTSINGPQDIHVANLMGSSQFPEVISGMASAYGVYYWENENGTDYYQHNFPGIALNSPRVFSSGDLDGDGDNDVLVAHSTQLFWYRNLGGGNFSASIQISNGGVSTINSIIASDIDLDGDLDIVIGYSHGIKYYQNLGSGTFSGSYALAVDDDVTYIDVHDVNFDNLPDIVYAQISAGNVFWLENISLPGCTDVNACNYSENAYSDDGSCCYSDCGCTISWAINYDEAATCNNGSCLYELSGYVFNDLNSNGIWDDGEAPLALQQVDLPALSLTGYTNDEGMFMFTVGEGEFEILLVDNPMYPFNTTPATLEIATSTGNLTGQLFGVSIDAPQFAICVDFYPSGNGFFCNDILNFNICFRNMGNVPIDGIVEVEYDPLFQGYLEQTPISNVVGNSVYMNFQNLQPNEMYFYDLGLYTPTVDYIGEYVTSTARVSGYLNDVLVAFGEEDRTLEVTCAYDPNDKRVFPEGYTEEHLVRSDAALDFQVRFQNTGNAPATDIIIRDTLDANLDISTFMLMANTHSVITTINSSTREVTFLFQNIQLPDSTCCEEDSHGFVSYMIHPLSDLDAGTVIHNTGYIYFDNNPPIVTNTTWSTIHECNPALSLSGELHDDCPSSVFEVSSNYDQSINWNTEYAWIIGEEVVGDESTLQLNANYPNELPLQLLATNPLCAESGMQTFELNMSLEWSTCYGDLDCNNVIGVSDLVAFMGEHGCEGPTCMFDLDGDSLTGLSDLLLFISFFGAECGE